MVQSIPFLQLKSRLPQTKTGTWKSKAFLLNIIYRVNKREMLRLKKFQFLAVVSSQVFSLAF